MTAELAVIDQQGNPVIPARRIETQHLIDRLKLVAIGEVITYEQLREACGADVRPNRGSSHLLVSAKRHVARHYNIVFVPVPGVGLQRCDDNGKVDVSSLQLKKSRRASGRAIKYALAVDDFNGLANDKKIEYSCNISMAKAIRHFSGDCGRKKLSEAVKVANDALPVVKSLEAFKNS